MRPARGASLRQGMLEDSNASRMQLAGGQRTFQLLTRVMKIQDEMLGVVNKIEQ